MCLNTQMSCQTAQTLTKRELLQWRMCTEPFESPLHFLEGSQRHHVNSSLQRVRASLCFCVWWSTHQWTRLEYFWKVLLAACLMRYNYHLHPPPCPLSHHHRRSDLSSPLSRGQRTSWMKVFHSTFQSTNLRKSPKTGMCSRTYKGPSAH